MTSRAEPSSRPAAAAGWSLLIRAGRAAAGMDCQPEDSGEDAWSRDAENLLPLAIRHRMIPLLARLAPMRPETESLRRQAMFLAARTSMQVEEMLSLSSVFKREGLRWLLFKGPGLSAEAYRDVAARPLDDLDICVHPDDTRAVCRLLTEQGYREQSRSPGESCERQRGNWGQEFRKEDGPAVIDLKQDVLPRYFGMNMSSLIPWAQLRTVRIDGNEIPVLPQELNVLALCGHGAWHRWERLLWLCDVTALLHRSPAIHADAQKIAAVHGWMGLYWAGVKTAESLLGLRPCGNASGVLPASIIRAREEAERVLLSPALPPPGMRRVMLFHLGLREKIRDRAAYLFRLVAFSGAGDWNLAKLPAAGAWVYRLLRPLRVLCRGASSLLR